MKLNDQAKNLEVYQNIAETVVNADGTMEQLESAIVREHYLDLIINEQLVSKLVCTPDHLAEMVIGRMKAEGYIGCLEDIEYLYICEHGSRAKVYLKKEIELKKMIDNEPTCCTGNQVFLANVNGSSLKRLEPVDWKREWIFSLAQDFAGGSKLHKATKGVHCCYLAVGGKTLYYAEDIGRHTAMDKAIGYAVMNNLDSSSCILYTTGRVPTDMVKKAVGAGIPILVSKAVVTDQAAIMAEQYNLTLICKAWPDRFVIVNQAK